MKKSKEYIISCWLFSMSLVMYCISMITGLIPGLQFSMDKICMYLGFSFLGLGLVFMHKSNEKK